MQQGKLFLKRLSSEFTLTSEDAIICGLDEVGRGCWAGPLFTCALVLKKDIRHKLLRDSKLLNPAQREKMYKFLMPRAYIGIGIAEVEEIDTLGLTQATNLAFQRALDQLTTLYPHIIPHYLLIDGKDKLNFSFPFRTVIDGDEKIKEIASAAIMAKVTRDRYMIKLSQQYPEYGFEYHKGYGTLRHQQALRTHGLTDIHRKRFKPVQALST